MRKNTQSGKWLFVGAVMAAAVVCMLLVLGGVLRDGTMIRHRSAHMVFYCQKAGVAQAVRMAEELETVYARAASCLGSNPGGKIKIRIHTDPDTFYAALAKAGVGADGIQNAFLLRETLHLGPIAPQDTASAQEAAYQMVRCMLRMLANRSENGFLGDCLAAYALRGTPFATLRHSAQAAAALTPAQLSNMPTAPTYAQFLSLGEADAYSLYVVFLSEEGKAPAEKGALWRVIRARIPTDYARATGFDSTAWNNAWQHWLQHFQPYSLDDFAEVS